MDYLTAIKTAIFVFPFIAFFFTIPFILHQYHKYGSIHKWRVLIVYSFILYMITIYFLVILPLPKRSEVVVGQNMVRLIPFGFVTDFLKETSFVWNDVSTYFKALTEPCVYVVVFNILMTVPFGMYMRYYFKMSFKKTVWYSFLLSLFFELTQLSGLYFIYPAPYRLFDVDDLILNTTGGALGYFLTGLFTKILPSRDEIDAESIEIGKSVSGLRRVTVFFLDTFLYLFFYTILEIFFSIPYLVFLFFLVYFVFYPYFSKGYTIGSRFLNLKLEGPHLSLICLFGRIVFLYAYYVGLPIFFLFGMAEIYYALSLSVLEALYFLLIVGILCLVFYIGHIFWLIKNRRIFYDSFFKLTYVSTVK